MKLLSKLISLIVIGLFLASCSSSPAPESARLVLSPSPLQIQWNSAQDFSKQSCVQLFVEHGGKRTAITASNSKNFEGRETIYSHIPVSNGMNFKVVEDESSKSLCWVAFNETQGIYDTFVGVTVTGFGELKATLMLDVVR